jgi:hypothetical protein
MAEIRAKGFDIYRGSRSDDEKLPTGYQNPALYNKIKFGAKTLDDAIFKLGDLKKANPRLADKATVLQAINNNDLDTMREISEFFYRVSGIYSRILRYMAFMYRYDWYVTPFIEDEKMKPEKVVDGFNTALHIMDNYCVKKTLGEIALKVLRQGCYYGYKVDTGGGIVLQELPPKYCRSRFDWRGKPAVEFNMKYFDDKFSDET